MEVRNQKTTFLSLVKSKKLPSPRKTNYIDDISNEKEKLKELVNKYRESLEFTKTNSDLFNGYKKFLYDSNLNDNERVALQDQDKPQLEFNQIGSFVSRLLGEFYKYDPSAQIEFNDDTLLNNGQMIEILKNHLNHEINDIKTKREFFDIYKDLLCGMSCVKIYTEYKNHYSFDQVIKIEKKDPTNCGYDPAAKMPNKTDARYCWEKFTYTEEEFKELFPDIDIQDIKSSYQNAKSPLIGSKSKKLFTVIDFYEKVKKPVTIVSLSDGSIMKKSEHDKKIKFYEAFKKDLLFSVPYITNKRKTFIEKIERYRFTMGKLLSYEKTDYSDLPYVFIGRTEVLKENDDLCQKEIIIPYFKNAIGAQKFINYAGSCFANALENIQMSKVMMAKESLPSDPSAQYGWLNPQKATVLIYNGFDEKLPDRQLPPPMPLAVQNMPPEVAQAFSSSMQLMQNALGSFDASLGINDNQLSGIAIMEGATQSNAAAMPYLAEFLMGMNCVFRIYLNLFPKYYISPRSIPILDKEGNKSFVSINTNNQNKIDYQTNDLGVQIKIGASSSIEKYKSLSAMTEIASKVPAFAQLLNQDGLDVILKNLDFKGSEILQSRYPQFKQQQAQAQQQAAANNPLMVKNQIEMQKVKLDEQKHNDHVTLESMDLKKETQKMIMQANQAQMEQFSKMMENQTKQMVAMLELKKEMVIHQDDHFLAKKDMLHKHLGDAIDRHHKIHKENQPEKEIENDKRVEENQL